MEADQATSIRKYITFNSPNRILHQNVSQVMDVRQFIFESAKIVDCVNGEGHVSTLGKGWLCATMVQTGESSSSSKSQQGFMSIDITEDNVLRDSLFLRGGVVFNKSVSSVVGSGEAGPALLTMISESGSLQLTYVRHFTNRPATLPVEQHVERRSVEEERRKKPSSSSTVDANGFALRDPRLLNRSKERKRESEGGSPRGDKRQKTHHESRNESEARPPPEPGTDAVAFLNYTNAALADAVDGALSSSMNVDVPGDSGETRSSIVENRATEDMGDSGLGEAAETRNSDDGGVEGSSNPVPPPNSQDLVPHSPRFDDIIKSLKKLFSDCKDKRLCPTVARLPLDFKPSDSDDEVPGTSSATAPTPPPSRPSRPVCEIKPSVRPVEERIERSDRRGRGRSTRSGNNRTRQPRRPRRRDREPDLTWRPPSFLEDGLEIVDEDEAAIAAAAIEGLM
ncbi:protein UL112 [Saimiriine betaherpesvirus 4]|uniref:Protein UL112 n=1 Tax=Saimiriine betaherpesvirus 4 TaxID=1535247 RepID=G8XT10_9BETA|nr:protein UL112 [Saimiriine betaherpesvirus 4]AEV80956.1 protein UL112 [Saimiriine betaherpesvirus 4]